MSKTALDINASANSSRWSDLQSLFKVTVLVANAVPVLLASGWPLILQGHRLRLTWIYSCW